MLAITRVLLQDLGSVEVALKYAKRKGAQDWSEAPKYAAAARELETMKESADYVKSQS